MCYSDLNDYLFASDEPLDNGKFVGGGSPGAAKTVADLSKMSYNEYKKYRQEN